MGKENEVETTVDNLEGLLGLHEENQENEDTTGAKENEGNTAQIPPESTEQTPPPESSTQPTVITPSDQTEIIKEILTIDIEIEKLSRQTVDVSAFYDNLETELSEEEQQLEFSDKSSYMKLVAQKAKDYEEKHSAAPEIEKLKSKKEELVAIQERQSALASVVSKYPDFSYEKVFHYFDKKLTKEQQQSIYDESKNYADVYEKAYLSYVKSNPTNIQQQNSPKIPNPNDVRKQTLDHNSVADAMTSDDERLQEALGL